MTGTASFDVDGLLELSRTFKGDDFSGGKDQFVSRLGVSSLSGILALHGPLAESGNQNVVSRFQFFLDQLEHAFHEFGASLFGKTRLGVNIFHELRFRQGHIVLPSFPFFIRDVVPRRVGFPYNRIFTVLSSLG